MASVATRLQGTAKKNMTDSIGIVIFFLGIHFITFITFFLLSNTWPLKFIFLVKRYQISWVYFNLSYSDLVMKYIIINVFKFNGTMSNDDKILIIKL